MNHKSIKFPKIGKHLIQFIICKINFSIWKKYIIFFFNMNGIKRNEPLEYGYNFGENCSIALFEFIV